MTPTPPSPTPPSQRPPWYAPLCRIVVMCVVLATLQWLTATNYDLALRGEAGTLAGMVLVYSLAEFLRT
jgi:hypothetical protein